jgi:hypothetical protein
MNMMIGTSELRLAQADGGIANGRYHGAGDERTDARYGHQLAATLAAMRQNLDLFGDVLDTLIKTAPIAAEVFNDPDHTR